MFLACLLFLLGTFPAATKGLLPLIQWFLNLQYALVKGSGEYDGVTASTCTQGFPTMFQLDKAVGATDLSSQFARQVLVPHINFTCNGLITKWIFGAVWRGNSLAYTEFQIWRKTCGTCSTYTKVGRTTVTVGGSNNSIYEYVVDPPLAVQNGDVFGYFQPYSNSTQLDLYLEDSNRIVTYYNSLSVNNVTPPLSGSTFSLDTASTGTRYPVVAVKTGKQVFIYK